MKNGFTLVELLVVITIIAILSVLGISLFTNVQKSVRDTQRRSDIISLQNAIRQYSFINHTFPPGGCSTNNNGDWPVAFKNALEPDYITQVPKDPINTIERRYCYTPNMWCSTGFSSPGVCDSNIANLWTYQESCSPNLIGDSGRFGYDCSHFMKSIDPF